MNLKELMANNQFTLFSRMGEEARSKNIETAKYIDRIVNASSINTDGWNIVELFGSGTGNHLISDRREINRRIFAKYRADQEAADQDQFTLEASIQNRLNDAARELVAARVQELQVNKDFILRDINRIDNSLRDKLQQAATIQYEMIAISGRNPDFGAQVKTIAAQGFWKVHSIDNDKVTFITVDDVNMRHVNPAANVDVRVNMGKYRAEVWFSNLCVQVYSVNFDDTNHIFCRAGLYPHPHVSTSGDPCWGASSRIARRYQASIELVGLMNLLSDLLGDYDDNAPYCSLSAYQEAIDNAQQNTPTVETNNEFDEDEGDF